MSRQSVWVLRTDVPAQRVFTDLKAAFGPNTPLLVGVLGEVLTKALQARPERRTGDRSDRYLALSVCILSRISLALSQAAQSRLRPRAPASSAVQTGVRT